MTRNADNSATCDRCGARLDGYGVLYGLISSDITASGDIRELIFCYANDCRTIMLTGRLSYLSDGTNCTDCAQPLTTRSVMTALLAADISPADGTSRQLAFCYANGSRDRLLAGNLGGTL